MTETRQEGAAAAAGWEALRTQREALGLTPAQVSAQLKLTVRQIEAIERGELEALPGGAFARGFVRNYVRLLGLDPAPFMALIDAGSGSREPVKVVERMETPSLGRMPVAGNPRFSALPATLVVLGIVVVLGLGWFFHWFESHDERLLVEAAESAVAAAPASAVPASAPAPEASVPAAMSAPVAASAPAAAASEVPASVPASSPVVAAASSSAASSAAASSRPAVLPVAASSAPQPAASAPLAAGLARIVLSFEGESWVEVRDASEKVVFSRLNQAGATQEVQGVPPFSMLIGNARHVRLVWRGQPVDLVPYTRGEVARLTVK